MKSHGGPRRLFMSTTRQPQSSRKIGAEHRKALHEVEDRFSAVFYRL
jgi:hypothetical protein